MAYNPRIADGILRRKLEGKGAVLIEGPKWCGKTTTAEQMAGSVVYMADPAIFSQNMDLAMISPGKLLDGVTPRLIDEWQVAPSLWDAVRFEVDHRHKPGQFILTGVGCATRQERYYPHRYRAFCMAYDEDYESVGVCDHLAR